jgi:hypothetical protein
MLADAAHVEGEKLFYTGAISRAVHFRSGICAAFDTSTSHFRDALGDSSDVSDDVR